MLLSIVTKIMSIPRCRIGKQLMLAMKLSMLLLTVALMSAHATVRSQTVTFEGKDVTLKKVFSVIREQTGYSVFSNRSDLDITRKVSLDVKMMPLNDLLQLLIGDEPVDFVIRDRTVVFSRRTAYVYLPPVDVQGVVRGADGKVLPGVTIRVKGATTGTTSDASGTFELNDLKENTVLQISSVGYGTIEIGLRKSQDGYTAYTLDPAQASLLNVTSGTRVLIDVKLAPATSSLDEVMINAGYYKVKDIERTGNITKITSKEIERLPVSNLLQALQGRVPGLNIMPHSGVPGAAPVVEVRGRNSVRYDGGYPLYIIDGVPVDAKPLQSNTNNRLLNGNGFDPLGSINPANIESVEILKDADATSIYGSRGANGVILITTKRGRASGSTDVDFRAYKGMGKVGVRQHLLSLSQYLEMRNEAYRNAGYTPADGGAIDLLVWDTTKSTDWQKVLLGGTSHTDDVQLSVSGGSQFTTFRLGGSYHRETLIFGQDFGQERATGTFSVYHTSSDQQFKVSLSANFSLESSKLYADGTIVSDALSLPPNTPPLRNEDGSLNWNLGYWNNPLSYFESTDRGKTNSWNLAGNVSYEILPHLELKAVLGYNTVDRSGITKHPFSGMNPAWISPYTTASAEFLLNTRRSWTVEPQLTYDRAFNEHRLNIVAGSSLQQSENVFQLVGARGYTSDVMLESLRGATNTMYSYDDNQQYKYVALLGRIGYSYRDKYFLNLAGRRDGSSRFGPNNRYVAFGSAGWAWLFYREAWVADNLRFLSFGKLRGSYGSTGSDQIGDYRFLSAYNYAGASYQGTIGLTPQTLANPDYAWELTRKLEFAAELGFLEDRVNVSASWYRNRSSNQLLDFPLPGISGFPSVISNLQATVQNKGWEVSLRTTNVRQQHFNWTSALNFTLPQNTLVAYPDFDQSPYALVYKVGRSLYINRTYELIGVNPQTGRYEVVDVNKDGQIRYMDDQQYIMDTEPEVYGGFTNSFTYKGFELNIFMQFTKLIGQHEFPAIVGFMGNAPAYIMDRWQKPGDKATYQKFSVDFADVGDPGNWALQSNFHFEDRSFVRLKSVSMSYQLQPRLLKRLGLKDGLLFFEGQNLLTITRSNALDPETGDRLPPLRVFSAGLQIKI